jgi:hypothetical protein
MDLDAAIGRAERAEILLNDQMLATAFDDARNAILEAWAGMPTGDNEIAKDLHRQLKCLELIKTVLRKHIDTGIIANAELKKMQGKRTFFK